MRLLSESETRNVGGGWWIGFGNPAPVYRPPVYVPPPYYVGGGYGYGYGYGGSVKVSSGGYKVKYRW